MFDLALRIVGKRELAQLNTLLRARLDHLTGLVEELSRR